MFSPVLLREKVYDYHLTQVKKFVRWRIKHLKRHKIIIPVLGFSTMRHSLIILFKSLKLIWFYLQQTQIHCKLLCRGKRFLNNKEVVFSWNYHKLNLDQPIMVAENSAFSQVSSSTLPWLTALQKYEK